MIDHIHIEQLEVQGRIGVPDLERAKPQRLVLNVTLWPRFSDLRDQIADTVNYSTVAQSVKEFAGQHHYHLIETLAEETAAYLLAQFKLRKAMVEVRKFVLRNAEFVSVTATATSEVA